MEKKMFNVGKIINTHGIKGEVKVLRITDFDERFEKGQELVWVSKDEKRTLPLTVANHRQHKGFDLLQFESLPSINDVEPLKEGMLKVSEDHLAPLDEGEYYYHEIIGCHVFTTLGEELGIIKEILSPGANDVWVVKQANKQDVLIPYIEQVVKQIDTDKKTVIIEPMEGLLD